MSAAASVLNRWSALTWRDLEDWAGATTVKRGRAYHNQGRVSELKMAADGRLLATVAGTRRYVVTLERTKSRGAIKSTCTCPVGACCKHAVATIAAVLEVIASGEEPPRAQDEDPRWDILADEADDDALDDAESGEDYDDDEWDSSDSAAPRRARRKAGLPDRLENRLRAQLRDKSAEQLTEMILSLVNRLPEARAALLYEVAVQSEDAPGLIAAAQREIDEVTSIIPWVNHWDGTGEQADYTRVERLLGQLTEIGRADDVVSLGRTLLARGMEQVGQANDEGETAAALSECLEIVFRAVTQSCLSPAKQILFAIDAMLADDFDVLADSTEVVLRRLSDPAEWSKVADTLAKRLGRLPGPPEIHSLGERSTATLREYERDSLSGWLTEALERGGRSHEVLEIYEREARATGSYSRLVTHLIAAGRTDDARRWALEGIERTCNELPGIAFDLARQLCEQARNLRDWPTVAAHAAQHFFAQPRLETLDALLKAAGKARCRRAVLEAALEFLGTGRCPFNAAPARGGAKKGSDPDRWPLPMPEEIALLIKRRPIPRQPHHEVLLEKALAAKNTDDVLHWYDRICAARKRGPVHWLAFEWQIPMRVAAAVARSHPDRALAIYEDRLNNNLQTANQSAYEIVGDCLRKTRPILKQLGREAQWHERVAHLREQYRRRPRFIEVLDALEDRPIVQTLKNRTARKPRS